MLCDRRWSIVNARTQPRCCGEEKEHRSSAELPLRELTDVRRESDVYVPQERSPLGNAPERFRSGEQSVNAAWCAYRQKPPRSSKPASSGYVHSTPRAAPAAQPPFAECVSYLSRHGLLLCPVQRKAPIMVDRMVSQPRRPSCPYNAKTKVQMMSW